MKRGWGFLALLLGMGMAGLTACAPRGEQATPVFVPPTAAVTPTPRGNNLPLEGQPSPQATATPQCTPQLRYLKDISIPDGSLVQPGETLDKRWAVENAGTCNWDSSYTLRLIAGPSLDAPEEQPLYPARASAQAVIRILFTAPQEPGTYRSAWQAYDPAGNPFGDPIFIEIQVAAP